MSLQCSFSSEYPTFELFGAFSTKISSSYPVKSTSSRSVTRLHSSTPSIPPLLESPPSMLLVSVNVSWSMHNSIYGHDNVSPTLLLTDLKRSTTTHAPKSSEPLDPSSMSLVASSLSPAMHNLVYEASLDLIYDSFESSLNLHTAFLKISTLSRRVTPLFDSSARPRDETASVRSAPPKPPEPPDPPPILHPPSMASGSSNDNGGANFWKRTRLWGPGNPNWYMGMDSSAQLLLNIMGLVVLAHLLPNVLGLYSVPMRSMCFSTLRYNISASAKSINPGSSSSPPASFAPHGNLRAFAFLAGTDSIFGWLSYSQQEASHVTTSTTASSSSFMERLISSTPSVLSRHLILSSLIRSSEPSLDLFLIDSHLTKPLLPCGISVAQRPWIANQLWKARNDVVFENHRFTTSQVDFKILSNAKEWLEARKQPHIPPLSAVKHPTIHLSSSFISYYVDTAWQASTFSCGMSWCFLDPSSSATHLFTSFALMGKVLALKSALEADLFMEIQHLNVFSDSLSLVSLINSTSAINELESVLFDIRCLIETFSSIFISYVSHLSNVALVSVNSAI